MENHVYYLQSLFSGYCFYYVVILTYVGTPAKKEMVHLKGFILNNAFKHKWGVQYEEYNSFVLLSIYLHS